MSKSNRYLSSVAALAVLASAIFAASQNFVPDVVFKGSSLTGWHKLGAGDWRAENGEIIGTPKEEGGWLVLDKGYQDIAFYASFRCAGRMQDRGAAARREDRRRHEGHLRLAGRRRRRWLRRDSWTRRARKPAAPRSGPGPGR